MKKHNPKSFMKHTILFFALLILTSCGVQKVPLNELHTLEPVKLYENSNDFLNKQPMEKELGILVKDKSDQHITTKGIFDLKTGEKSKNGISAWAIEYNKDHYFNLGYSTDVNHWGSYAKFDIEGKYCAIIIDENSPYILKSTSQTYGGGLAGGLIAESLKWGKNWKDEEGNKKRILFIDTEDIHNKMMSRNESAHGNYFTKKQFKKILDETGTVLTDEKIKEIEFHRIIELIKSANEK
ncbi:hypothetical protein [Salegentibacter maritimus]|uniref:Lipoprotein n=1 Tax=Salegentibacter maritimus TaxID=2794347 RepID=A0ABS0TH71_9FLAO|nr:hypothetical protein [Salegentibacter maritimus]MBI6120410.1 hypothetical protein [Salegentibacter maritimus]